MKISDDTIKFKWKIGFQTYIRFLTDANTFSTSVSKMIEAIIIAYCEDSTCIGESAFHEICFQKTLKQLTESPTEISQSRARKNKNDPVIQWTITNPARELLNNDARTTNQKGTFIRALIEEFVDFPFHKKERIVLYKQFNSINNCIKNKKAFQYTYASGGSYIMHPYKISIDTESNFTYVIGHKVPAQGYNSKEFEPSCENIGCIRLLNMLYTRKTNFTVIGDSKINVDAISEKLANTSVAFLSEDPCIIHVLLTPTGENMFRTILNKRPPLLKKQQYDKPGFVCYEVFCTPFQASIYFCTFENHAQIIDPPEAVEKIKSRLKAAYEMYE